MPSGDASPTHLKKAAWGYFSLRARAFVRVHACACVCMRARIGEADTSRGFACVREGGKVSQSNKNLPKGGDDEGRRWGEGRKGGGRRGGGQEGGEKAGRRGGERKLVYAPEEKRHNGKNL